MRPPNENAPNTLPPAPGPGSRPEPGHGVSWIRALAGEWRRRQKAEAAGPRLTPPPRRP